MDHLPFIDAFPTRIPLDIEFYFHCHVWLPEGNYLTRGTELWRISICFFVLQTTIIFSPRWALLLINLFVHAVEFGLYSKYLNQRLWLQMLVICNQARMHNDNIIPNLCFMKLAIPLPPMSPVIALGRRPGCISARGPQRVDISGQRELDAAVQQQLYIA